MKLNRPSVTVLMPAFNSMDTVSASIKSILDQTFTDFEFLIIDDGSTDLTLNQIKTFADPRIRLIQNEVNLGLIRTLNLGLKEARGNLIARMDSDDISHPQRLELQTEFLKANPDVVVCGSCVREVGATTGRTNHLPLTHEGLMAAMTFDCPIAHPSVMFRKSVLDQHNLSYNTKHKHAEDFGLWVAFSRAGRLANLPDVLLDYLIQDSSVTGIIRKNPVAFAERQTSLKVIFADVLERLGIKPDEQQLNLHLASLSRSTAANLSLEELDRWYDDLLEVAVRSNAIDTRAFVDELASRRIRAYRWNNTKGMRRYFLFRRGSVQRRLPLLLFPELKLLLKSFLNQN